MAGNNVCSCPPPSKTLVRCETHQMAYCRTDSNGASDGGCIDPPKTSGLAAHLKQKIIQNWALAVITKTPRGALDEVKPRDAKMLMDGHYRDSTTGDEVQFVMPQPAGRPGAGGGGSGGDEGLLGPRSPNFADEREAEEFWADAVFEAMGVLRLRRVSVHA